MICGFISWITWVIYLFSSGSHLYVSFKWQWTKVSASLLWLMQIFDSTLNITFIQLFTCYGCFSLAYFNLILFCLYVGAVFLLYTNPISFSWFLTVLLQVLTSVLTNLFSFIWLYIFYFQGILLWVFYSDALISFLAYQYIFLFLSKIWLNIKEIGCKILYLH